MSFFHYGSINMARPPVYKHHFTIEMLSDGFGEQGEAQGEMCCPECEEIVSFCQYMDEEGIQEAFQCPNCGAWLALVLTLVSGQKNVYEGTMTY